MVLPNGQAGQLRGAIVFQQHATPVVSGSGNAATIRVEPTTPPRSTRSAPNLLASTATDDKMAVRVKIERSNSLVEAQVMPMAGVQEQRPAWPEPGAQVMPMAGVQVQRPAWPEPATFATPRGYHIPRRKYEAAARCTPPNPSAYWQYDMFEGSGGHREKVILHYCNDKESMEKAAKFFLEEEVIGLDIKWPREQLDGIKNNVSIIQCASESRIALFHLAQFPDAVEPEDFVTPSFRKLMESPEITKVGASIKYHTTRLPKFLGIEVRSLFELSYLHKLIGYRTGTVVRLDRRAVALAIQAQEHLGLPISEDENLACSDWTSSLDHEQIQYAATRSYANLFLFHIMEAKRLTLHPVAPRPAHAEFNDDIRAFEQESIENYLEAFQCNCTTNSENVVEDSIRTNPSAPVVHSPQCRQGQKTPTRPSAPRTPTSRGSASRRQTAFAMRSPLKSPSKSPAPRKAANPAYAAHLDQANKFAEQHRDPSNKYLSAQVLRVYSLWHEQGLDVPVIANIFVEGPILNRTVIGYLYDALANLPQELHCPPQKIIEMTERYTFSPYVFPHKMVLSTAKEKVRKAGKAEGA